MNRKIRVVRGALCVALIFTVTLMYAQKSKGTFTATFKDGMSVSYTVYQNMPNEIFSRHFSALSLGNHIGITNEFSYQKIVPGKMLYKAGIFAGYFSGFGGVTASGIYYLGTSSKEAKQRITVRTTYQGADHYTRYVTTVPVTMERYWGIHGEAGFHRTGFKSPYSHYYNNAEYALESVSYGVLAAGFGYNSFRGLQVKIRGEEYAGGSRMFTAAADLVLYPGMNIKATGVDSLALTHDLESKDVSSGMIGFHIFAQLHSSFLYHKDNEPKGCIGIVWRLGIEKAPYINEEWNVTESKTINPELGLGLFYTFY